MRHRMPSDCDTTHTRPAAAETGAGWGTAMVASMRAEASATRTTRLPWALVTHADVASSASELGWTPSGTRATTRLRDGSTSTRASVVVEATHTAPLDTATPE